MSKKNKFDFKKLVQKGYANDGEKFYFVSDPSYHAILKRTPNGTFKLIYDGQEYTPHSLVINWLGMEPDNAALRWIKNEDDRTLHEIWEDFQHGVEPLKKAA